MAAPSKNWTDILDTAIDAESPITELLLTQIRDNIIHVKEWLGFGFTASQAHTHNGLDSAPVVDADDSIPATALARTNEISLFDDFLDETALHGPLENFDATVLFLTGEDNGVISIESAISGGRYAGVGQQINKPFRLNTGATITFETKVSGNGTGNALRIGAGLWDGTVIVTVTDDQIIFRVNSTNNKIQCITTSGGISTVTDTDTDLSTTTKQRLTFIATPAQVLFYVDGILKVTHTTDIPGISINMGVILGVATTGVVADYDYGFCHQDKRN